MVRKVLLICGIVSSLLYVAMNIVGAMQFEGYDSTSQAVSELFAIGAPSRPVWVLLGIVYQVLVIAFGWGVWASAGRNRPLRVVGGLLLAYGVVGLAAPFFPMHMRGAGVTLTDTMHKILTMVTVLLMLTAIGFGAAAFGKWLRFYSIATIVILLVFGVLTGLEAARIEANLPTPWVGVTERIDIGVFLLWVVVLAVALLRTQGDNPKRAILSDVY
jgi:hypothetical protein